MAATKKTLTRQEKGIELFKRGVVVKKIDETTWEVQGSNGNTYQVSCNYDQWHCTCPDNIYRGNGGSSVDRCKHSYLVKYWLETSVPTAAPIYDKHDIHMHREKMLVVF